MSLKGLLARIRFFFMSPTKKEKIFNAWLVDQVIQTGIMPPPDLLTKEQYERFQKALKSRQEYESLFQEIPFPSSLMEQDDEIYRQD